MLSQSFINQIKQNTDIVKLAKCYVELKLVGSGIWQGICPHPDHQDDTPSFVIWVDSQSWACMGCHNGKKGSKYKNYGSDCFALLQWLEKISWRESVLKLAKKAGIEPEKEIYEELYKHQSRLAIAYHRNTPEAVRAYLFQRGLNKIDIDNWLIGFDGSRVTFPLFNRYKKIIGFSKRRLLEDKESVKYKNSPNTEIFNKSMYLYGIHHFDDDFDEIRISEGAMDVIMPHKYGVKNIVSTLGTSFTKQHVEMIKNLNKIPVLCMDGDKPGQKSAKKAISLLAEEGVFAKILFLPNGMDMANLANKFKYDTEDYIQNHSITYGQMIVQDVVNQYEAKMNETKVRLFPLIKEALKSIKNDDERKVISDYISEKMSLIL